MINPWPMVERSIAWVVADNHRRVGYRSVRRNQLGLSLRVAAVNLRRLVNLGLAYDGTWVLVGVETIEALGDALLELLARLDDGLA